MDTNKLAVDIGQMESSVRGYISRKVVG